MPRGPEGFSKPTTESVTEYAKEYSKIREEIFEKIPNNLEGINTERINLFVRDSGLRAVPFLFIEREQVPLLHEISIEPDMILENSNGYYSDLLDLVVVVRDPELEALNGAAYSEGIAVHELAHASNEWLVRVSREGINDSGHKHTDERIVRKGFKHRTTGSRSPRGEYLEEAFAQMFCVTYTQKNMDEVARKNFATWLSEESFEEIPNIHFTIKMSSGEAFETTPANMYFNKEGPTVPTPGYAQPGLEKLWRSIDGLKETMMKSRKDPALLSEIPKLINTLDPDLYAFLSKLDYTATDFNKGTREIEKLLKNRT